MKWIALCNGGRPNDTTVGAECDSLGKACGTLESMMRNLGASIGQIQKVENQRTLDQGVFVKTEKEAGKTDTKDTRFIQGIAAALDVVALYDQPQVFKDILLSSDTKKVLAEIKLNGLERTKKMAEELLLVL